MQVNCWEMVVSPTFWEPRLLEVASRNSDRARGQVPLVLARAEVAAGGPIRTESGDIMNDPSDDEPIPYVSREDLATR